MEQVGGLLGGDLLIVGDDPDVFTALDVVEDVGEHLHDRCGHLDRLAIGTLRKHHDATAGEGDSRGVRLFGL